MVSLRASAPVILAGRQAMYSSDRVREAERLAGRAIHFSVRRPEGRMSLEAVIHSSDSPREFAILPGAGIFLSAYLPEIRIQQFRPTALWRSATTQWYHKTIPLRSETA